MAPGGAASLRFKKFHALHFALPSDYSERGKNGCRGKFSKQCLQWLANASTSAKVTSPAPD